MALARCGKVVNGLDGLLDEPRPGAPRWITDKRVEAVISKTLESMTTASTHWSTRLMAEKAGLSQTAVGMPLDCNRTDWRTSNYPKTLNSLRRFGISSVCT